MARTFRVSVKDEKGEPMPLVSVYASRQDGTPDGSGVGANTDFDGNATFTGEAQYISARSVGYTTQTAVAKLNNYQFALAPSVTRLKTVVITADKPTKTKKPVNYRKVVGWGIGILAAAGLVAAITSIDEKD